MTSPVKIWYADVFLERCSNSSKKLVGVLFVTIVTTSGSHELRNDWHPHLPKFAIRKVG